MITWFTDISKRRVLERYHCEMLMILDLHVKSAKPPKIKWFTFLAFYFFAKFLSRSETQYKNVVFQINFMRFPVWLVYYSRNDAMVALDEWMDSWTNGWIVSFCLQWTIISYCNIYCIQFSALTLQAGCIHLSLQCYFSWDTTNKVISLCKIS